MKTYPVNLLLENKKCLIVGGGKVAARKMNSLLNANAAVIVTAPEPHEKIAIQADDGTIILNRRGFEESDLDGIYLVYATTSDRALNKRIVELAKERSIPVCSVDANWRDGDFITPASASYGDITIAVSSCGVSCRKTKMIKEDISKHIRKIEGSELVVIGTDHRYLNLTERENMHIKDYEKTGGMINSIWGMHEFVLFNTCNRIEMIGIGNADSAAEELLKLILGFNNLESKKYYVKRGFDAFKHIVMTISGMYSQTPGENHIISQFKNAVAEAERRNWADTVTESLKNALIHISKRIRTEIVSKMKVLEIENVALEYLKRGEYLVKNKKIFILGTGVIGRNLYGNLKNGDCAITLFYHKNSPDFVRDADMKTEIKQLRKLPELLPQCDILISAVSTDKPVLDASMKKYLKKNTVLLDLGVPRNIVFSDTPRTALPDDTQNTESKRNIEKPATPKLVQMDDLKHWYRKNICDINELQADAEKIIEEHREYYERFKNSFIDGHQGQ